MSMDLMLREGLLPVLIGELDAYLTSNDEYRKKKREEKQQATKKRKLSEKSTEPVCKVIFDRPMNYINIKKKLKNV